MLTLGCDPNRERYCEWYLVPEPRHEAPAGYIPVCARNYTNNKQNCRLKATLAFAQRVYGKPFRYVDLEIAEGRFPRTVTAIQRFCQP